MTIEQVSPDNVPICSYEMTSDVKDTAQDTGKQDFR